MTNLSQAAKAERVSHLRWVPIADMKVSPKAQREFRRSHAEMIAADFDLESLGFPVVSQRGGSYYILDGQHRVAALKLIGYGDQQIQCECYEGMTEEDEAKLFLRRSNTKAIPLFEKYKIGITAGLERECDIDRTLRSNGFTVSRSADPKSVGCVGSLYKVYDRAGAGTMAWAVRVAYESFGDEGLEASVIEGFGLIRQRYNGQLPSEEEVTGRLNKVRAGVTGLFQRAAVLRRNTGSPKAQCVAAAAIEAFNQGRGGAKLPDWWKS